MLFSFKFMINLLNGLCLRESSKSQYPRLYSVENELLRIDEAIIRIVFYYIAWLYHLRYPQPMIKALVAP